MTPDSNDKLYFEPRPNIDDFAFNDQVADVFSDMISRSVPGYQTTLETIGVLTGRYAKAGSNCYDLGCSLGAATLAMRHNIDHDDCKIFAIDNSPAMVARCRKTMDQDHSSIPVEVIEANLQDQTIVNASVVVMNFTLQFIEPEQRQLIINRIFTGLQPGGILILSEKLSFSDARVNSLHLELHQAFKRSRGYSELEIAQKRTSLENILIPDTLSKHRQRMAKAGFSSCDVWFQCFNFVSLLALK